MGEAGFSFPSLEEKAPSGSLGPPLTLQSTVKCAGQGGEKPVDIQRPPASGPPEGPRAAMGRSKVPFEKGFSQMDWMRLTKTDPNLNGLNGARPSKKITLEELGQHSTPEDAWMAVRGKVYSVTKYANYHPGGAKILLAAAGKDATKLFDRYHPWVNVEMMLAKAYVGRLEPPPAAPQEAQPGS
ncbi:unnamed protein product [Pedinophyceae sp. YPF-701]|nr:unnamed protein product [Pedinophyceae sp. YPF-701]